LALALFFIGTVYGIFYIKELKKGEINKINTSTEAINQRSQEIEARISDTKKYKEAWKQIDAKKRDTSGIKMDEITKSMERLSEKYDIYKPEMKFSVPEKLSEAAFTRKTIDVFYSSGLLNFVALDDIKTMSFVNEFFRSVPGYIIITSFDTKKNLQYSEKTLVEISSGRAGGMVSSKIEFLWYGYKNK
jgi:hypothetical protein